jgi:hypothetical protein
MDPIGPTLMPQQGNRFNAPSFGQTIHKTKVSIAHLELITRLYLIVSKNSY